MTDRIKALENAARAVVDRWDSPLWGGSALNLKHTGEYIARLRAALAASQPAPDVAVKVKPLVWKKKGWGEYAEAMQFVYLLCEPNSSDECNGWYVLEEHTNTVIQSDGSRAAAKAAAQADYDARIMAALDVQPLTVQDAARHILSDDIAISHMAQALHDGPLGADDHWFSAARPQGAWCVDAVRVVLRAIAEGRA